MCGEHAVMALVAVRFSGSSPHVRGARLRVPQRGHGHGIIPACAGSTVTLSAMHEEYWDHPRMSGEHTKEPSYTYPYAGSSPHVRGARKT